MPVKDRVVVQSMAMPVVETTRASSPSKRRGR
jgi:hypothetical protein